MVNTLPDAQNIPNLDVPPTIVFRPYAEDILATSHTHYHATDLLARFCKLVAHDCEKYILPIPVNDTFLQPDDPLSTLLVFLVFPHWSDVLFEQVVI